MLEKSNIMIAIEEAEGLLFACDAGLSRALRGCWERGLENRPLDAELRVGVRSAVITANREYGRIARSLFDVAGTKAIKRDQIIQRLYRKSSTLVHHASASNAGLETIGRVRIGLDELSWKV